jgi:hypothetical protein
MCLTVWMSGVEPAPTDVFLKVVDLIVERDVLEDLRPKDAADPKQIKSK